MQPTNQTSPEVNSPLPEPLPQQEEEKAPPAGLAPTGAACCGFLSRYTPHVIVFCSSACIMVVELVAGRLTARHLGSSLYTWTSIIAVILAGMSVGNVIGGKLADRRKPEQVLGWLFLCAAAIWVLTLGVNYVFAELRPLRALDWPAQIFFTSLLIFILPAIALGTISPAAAKMALARSNRVGATLGSFYAWAVAGSILGTFLTGFWLIEALGSRGVVLTTALGLALLGLALVPWRSVLTEKKLFGEPAPNADPQANGDAVGQEAKDTGEDAGVITTGEDPPATADEAEPSLADWYFTPYLVAFFTAACMMVVEMLAGRMIARQVGSSLYTWTSVIGVVLAGVSIGSFIAGWLADWFKPQRLLGWLFLLSSATCMVTLYLNYYFWMNSPLKELKLPHLERASLAPHDLQLLWKPADLHWPGLVFLTVLCVFFLPSLFLGMFSPVAAKLALRDKRRIGFTLGSVSAWGAAGSILGTIAAGFWLISMLGTKGLLLVVALALGAVGLLFWPLKSARPLWVTLPMKCINLLWVLLLIYGLIVSRDRKKEEAVLAHFAPARNSPFTPADSGPDLKSRVHTFISEALACMRDAHQDLFNADSKYQYIRVYSDTSKEEPERSLRVLALDFLIHGYVDPEDPGHLEYAYENVYANVARRYAHGRQDIAALFLGGGSYTFPRWTLHEWPKAKIVVAEIDPMVIEANHEALGLPRKTPIRTIPLDARIAVDSLAADEKFDFALGDAFNDLSSPYHLCTREFDEKIKRHLKPDGAYLVNVIDSYECGLLVGSLTATLKQVFKHVSVFCTEPDGVKDTRDTFVIAASDVPLETSDWQPGHGKDLRGSVLTDDNLAVLARKCGNRVLTDDDSPVENLIAPVLRLRKQP